MTDETLSFDNELQDDKGDIIDVHSNFTATLHRFNCNPNGFVNEFSEISNYHKSFEVIMDRFYYGRATYKDYFKLRKLIRIILSKIKNLEMLMDARDWRERYPHRQTEPPQIEH